MGRLRKFWSLSRLERLVFCEACILLLISNMSVKSLAFRHISNFLNGRPRCACHRIAGVADDIRLVRQSLSRAANSLPWSSLCLSRAIAAFIMLRRRHIPAIILLGVKVEESSLFAHAWVRAGDEATNEPGAAQNTAFTSVMSIG
jgi:hypothetical protein